MRRETWHFTSMMLVLHHGKNEIEGCRLALDGIDIISAGIIMRMINRHESLDEVAT